MNTDKNLYAQRFRILNRDGFTCQYCGQFAPNVILHVDHKHPAGLGGGDEDENLITACSACNIGKNLSPLSTPPEAYAEYAPKPYRRPFLQAIKDHLAVNGQSSCTEISKAIARDVANISRLLNLHSCFVLTQTIGRRRYYTWDGT